MTTARTGPTARELARAQMVEQIKDAARARLAQDGADLSLRAVARDLGVVSSAVYRYFASRDDLLTALIIDAYGSMADAVEQAEAAVPRRHHAARWSVTCLETRTWSLQRPHEFALLYGTPVPGYAAPADTIEAATRPLLVAAAIVRSAVEAGLETPVDHLPRPVRADLQTALSHPGLADVPPVLLARLMTAWATLFGTISFELFGRYTNVVEHLDEWFALQVRVMAGHLGLG